MDAKHLDAKANRLMELEDWGYLRLVRNVITGAVDIVITPLGLDCLSACAERPTTPVTEPEVRK